MRTALDRNFLLGLTLGITAFVIHDGIHLLVEAVFLWGLMFLCVILGDEIPPMRWRRKSKP